MVKHRIKAEYLTRLLIAMGRICKNDPDILAMFVNIHRRRGAHRREIEKSPNSPVSKKMDQLLLGCQKLVSDAFKYRHKEIHHTFRMRQRGEQ